MNRKEIKAEAKKVVKKHYLLSVAICLMAMLFSSVFINQMENNLVVDKINEVMGEDTVGTGRYWKIFMKMIWTKHRMMLIKLLKTISRNRQIFWAEVRGLLLH